jgi:hypothetical protein
MNPTLSKSEYVKGLQCPKALWFQRFRKSLKPEINVAAQAQFDTGNETSLLAQSYYPDGVKITSHYSQIASGEKLTRKVIAKGHTIIYEATAISPVDGSHARIDIFRKVEGSDAWDLIEVKSTTSVKSTHIDDMALQFHAFSDAGYQINKCYMMIIDNTYVRSGKIDLLSLFRLEDISSQVHKKQAEVKVQVEKLLTTLDMNNQPTEEIGARCNGPFECEYKSYCWQKVPEYSIFNIFSAKKADSIVKIAESYEIKDIPSKFSPSVIKKIDIEAYLTGNIVKDKIKIDGFLRHIQYPLYYLDYETIGPAIPLFDGTKPYEQIPFQFSLHIQNTAADELEHFEFLFREKTDPRKAFTQSLIKLCGSEGSIIVYNKSFEAACNNKLGAVFPAYAEGLKKINQRMVDLLVPFKKRWLYSPTQKGSASIKAVLPAFSTLDYKELEIAGGGEASSKYQDFAKGNISNQEADSLFENLSKYCSLDTYAMFVLIEKMRTINNNL